MFLDPWQAEVLDLALRERVDHSWAALEVAVIVPRQNGKGAILEARELAGLFLFDEELILHSAHEFKTAAEAFLRIRHLIESSDDLSKRVQRIRTAAGAEAIELRNGNRLRFVARSSGSGRGFSGDTVILDEAYHLPDKALAALLPTMSARPNPQLWYTSSAPLEGPESEVLRRICRRGRAGKSDRLVYVEFCADKDADHEDPESWAAANPGIGIRISEEFISAELESLEPVDFARERLGIWVDALDLANWVIPAEAWNRCETPQGMVGDPTAISFDMSPDRRSAWFAVAGVSAAGGAHLEIAEPKPVSHVQRAKQLHAAWKVPITIAENSPAWALREDFEQAGVTLLPVSTSEHAQACGRLFDAVAAVEVHHPGQPELTRALGGAEKRFYGDTWLWSRKTSSVDISPLVAVTLALWAHAQADDSSVYETGKELLTL